MTRCSDHPFHAAPGAAESDIPAPVDSVEQGLVEIRPMTSCGPAQADRLGARERLALVGLSVVRVTLEDIYLQLTRDTFKSERRQGREHQRSGTHHRFLQRARRPEDWSADRSASSS